MSDEETQCGDVTVTLVCSDDKSFGKRGEVVVGRWEFDETGWLKCGSPAEATATGVGVDDSCNSSRESSSDGIGC